MASGWGRVAVKPVGGEGLVLESVEDVGGVVDADAEGEEERDGGDELDGEAPVVHEPDQPHLPAGSQGVI